MVFAQKTFTEKHNLELLYDHIIVALNQNPHLM